MTAAGIDSIRAVVRSLAGSGGTNWKWQIAIQTAEVRPDNPDLPALLGSEQTNDGTYAPGDLTPDLSAKAYFRLGIAYRSVSGLSQADIEADFAWNDCGKVVSSVTFPITCDNSSPSYIPLGDILPANFAQKFKAAIIITSADANLQCKLVYRKGTVKAALTSWTDFTVADSYSASAERNTSERAISASTELWAQAGLAVKSTSGTSQGTITVLLMARKT